jgi:hypothetical protein
MFTRTRSRRTVAMTSMALAAALLLAGGFGAAASAIPRTLPATSGGIRVAHVIDLHHRFARSGTELDIPLAEAPNGAVFYATGSVVNIVEGDDAPVVAEHAASKVRALAANATYLYVQTSTAITEYARSTGTATASWPVRLAHGESAALFATGGVVWAVTYPSTGAGPRSETALREIHHGTTPKLIKTPFATQQEVIDHHGDIYLDSAAGYLYRVNPRGHVLRSSSHRFGDVAIDYVDHRLLAATLRNVRRDLTISPSTLRVVNSRPGHFADFYNLVDTTLGVLQLRQNCGPGSPCSAVRVFRVTLPYHRTGQVRAPYGYALLGPDPVVVIVSPNGSELLRLAASSG